MSALVSAARAVGATLDTIRFSPIKDEGLLGFASAAKPIERLKIAILFKVNATCRNTAAIVWERA